MTRCPENIQKSILAYIKGRPVGEFLEAVLSNDLQESRCAGGFREP